MGFLINDSLRKDSQRNHGDTQKIVKKTLRNFEYSL